MSEPEAYTSLKQALKSSLINPRHETDVSSAFKSVFTSSALHSYILELRKSLQIMRKYIPSEITIPFKGNCLEITKCGRFFIFGSVEGRVGLVDADTKEVLQDIHLCNEPIYTLSLYNNDLNFLSGGKDGKIRSFNFATFEVVQTFEGHDRDINKIIVSSDEKYFYSASDDGTVIAWKLDNEGDSKVLYYHDKEVLSLDKSSDGLYLISGGADKKVKIFNLQTEVVEKTIAELPSSVWTVKFSGTGKLLAAGDGSGNIKIWDIDEFKLQKFLTGHDSRVTQIEFNQAETCLISSSNDQTLRVWDLVQDKNELVLTGHTSWVKAFKQSPDGRLIYSISENCKIFSWHFPRFDKSSRHREHKTPINLLCYSRNNHLIFTSDKTETKVWDVKTKQVIKSMPNEWDVTAMAVDSDNLTLLIAYSNYHVYSWNIEHESYKSVYENSTLITALVPSPDGQFLAFADINYRLIVLFKRKFEISNVFKRHINLINVIAFGKPVLSENDLLFSAGEDQNIFIYSIKENRSKKLPQLHSSPVTVLSTSRKNDILISGDQQGLFKIWNISQLICIKSLKAHTDKITGIYFSENLKNFWISSADSSISLWNSVSYSKVTHLKSKFPISSFVCTRNEEEIVLTEGCDLNFLENPLKTTYFFIYGPGREYYSFMKYIFDLSEGSGQAHDSAMDSWIVAPYEINALHFYAYLNLHGHLKLAMQQKGPFYVSKTDYSPLTIAIHRNFRDCINAIIKQIRVNIQEDPYSVNYLEDSIVKLNEIGFKGLDEFYSAVLYKSTDRNLPKFCENIKLPIYVFSRHLAPQQKNFFSEDQVTSFGTPLTFWQSALRLDMVMGSNDSIAFLESLVICPNPNIFKTNFIKELILYKWSSLKWVLMPQASVYGLYLLCVAVYLIVFQGESGSLLLVIFGLNLLLALYESLQLSLTKSKYFKDGWNYIDFLRGTLCFVYAILKWLSFEETLSKQLLVLLTLMSCIRGIIYFRLFSPTRYMVNLLAEVVKDMRSFLILFFYSTYSFALVYFIMVNNVIKLNSSDKTVQPFSYYISDSYLLSLGEFSTENYGFFEWVIFLFASIINPLIMLNLLISIIGGTYAKVKESQEITDMKEMTGMVIEGEYLLFWNRKNGSRRFLQICKDEGFSSSVTGVEDELISLKLKVREIESLVLEKTSEMKQDISETFIGVNHKVDELTDLVEQISLAQE